MVYGIADQEKVGRLYNQMLAHLGDRTQKAIWELRLVALERLYDTDDDFNYRNFRAWPEIPREVIRGVVRDLRDMGLVAYGKGLWTLDGEMGGSGYRLTADGRVFMDMHTLKEVDEAALQPFKKQRRVIMFWRR